MTGPDPAAVYARLAEDFLGREDVTTGRMLKAEALRANGKSFAYLSEAGLVLKLPRARIDALEADTKGTRLVVGARVMKEWVVIAADHIEDWSALAEASYSFVRNG